MLACADSLISALYQEKLTIRNLSERGFTLTNTNGSYEAERQSPSHDRKTTIKKQRLVNLQRSDQPHVPLPGAQETSYPSQALDITNQPTAPLPIVHDALLSHSGDTYDLLSESQYQRDEQISLLSTQPMLPAVPATPQVENALVVVPSFRKQSTIALPITPIPSLPSLPITPLPALPAPPLVRGRVQLIGIMNSTQQLQYVCCVVGWLAVNVYFWSWWLTPAHVGNLLLYSLMTAAFFYEQALLPSLYTFFIGQMRIPSIVQETIIPASVQRVAVISLTVPGSESLEIVKRQMVMMKNIRYPHDSWILVDKVHSPEIQKLAEEVGVRYFSRHDIATWGAEQVAKWNQPVPPFKAKTKAGNVNSWLDAYGNLYSHFTQFDIDHLPVPDYLHKVLKYFADPKVKWVQAPSVYGNLDRWAARGSAEQEFVLHGPLQMGFFGYSRTPFIIGSHCTYDMASIREIGGFQPTRAEDHLDTVFLAAKGYEGVFLPEVIAVGDGPETFETYLAQQFAWAYSMIQVFFQYTPKRIPHYTPRQALQFLFVQTWYILWACSMLLLFTLPVLSLFLNAPISHVNYWEFLLHSLPLIVMAFNIWLWSHPWHFPKGLELSWRGVVLHVARWPVVLSALIQVILRVEKPYMITVKGLHVGLDRPFALKPHYPYFVLIGVSLIACWYYLLFIGHSDAQGYLFFALQGVAILLVVYVTALMNDMLDLFHDGITWIQCIRLRLKPLLVLACLLFLSLSTALWSAQNIYMALFAS